VPTPDFNVLLAVIFGLGVLYLAAMMLAAPIRLLFRLVTCLLIGVAGLLIFNLAGGFLGLNIGLNLTTTLVAGYMGLPGLVMLILLQRLLG